LTFTQCGERPERTSFCCRRAVRARKAAILCFFLC
jgi:hypothetical protein